MALFTVIVMSVLFGLLLWLSIVDVFERRLPNGLVLAVAVLGIVFSFGHCVSACSWLPLKESLLGVLFTAAPAFLFSLIYYFVRGQEGFGAGDIKLLAALGLYLGVAGITVLPFASILAAMVTLPRLLFSKEKVRKQTIAFGPYISLAAFLLLIANVF